MSRKGLVVGNCQVKSLAFALNYVISDVEFEHFQIHSFAPGKAEEAIAKKISESQELYDVILTFSLSDKFFGLAHDKVRDSFPKSKVLSISNLFFSGYFPDVVTLGGMGARIDGALQQYRSSVALFGFMHGWGLDKTLAAYNHETYQKANFYSSWNGSIERMIESDQKVDIKFADEFTDQLAFDQHMYVVNHPTPEIFRRWSNRIADHLTKWGLAKRRAWEPATSFFPAFFTDTPIWPVYPEIVKNMHLRFKGSYMFKTPGYGTKSFLNLTDFVKSEFAAFEKTGAETIAKSAQWPDIRRRLAALGVEDQIVDAGVEETRGALALAQAI